MAAPRPISDVHQAVVDFIDAGRRFALVVVLHDAGSTPRQSGTKALIEPGGAIHGTIGGGLLEHEARIVAERAVASGQPEVFDFHFDGKGVRDGEPVCGGTMRILVDPASINHRAAYAAAAEARRERKRGVLFTHVAHGSGHLDVSVRWEPRENDEAPAPDSALWRGEPLFLFERHGPFGREETLVEPLVPRPLLVIVGGGHVGQALARHAALIDVDFVVVDDRPAFAEADRFPGALAVRCGNITDELATLPLDRDTYVALVSRGHRTDAEALAVCLRHPGLAYVGMMGSRRKIGLLRKEFIDTGVATAAAFDRIHAPIGLDIGAETPSEIAASIVAELIAVMRRNDPAPQRDPAARRKVRLR
jgi:xanthine dehydrogenase accessory factor